MILMAEVPHTPHRMIRIKESSHLTFILDFVFVLTQKATLLLSSHGASCLSGCLSRNRRNLEFTRPFIQKHKQLNPFLEKK